MKTKPEILLSSKNPILFKKILISGSDESFMLLVKEHIINDFKKRNFFIDVSNNYNGNIMGNLFSEKKTLFVLSDFPKNKEQEYYNSHDQSILVALPNGKKTNLIKSMLAKNKESLVIECYSMDRISKENTLKNYIENNNLKLSNDVFWYIIENFDNKYVIFIKVWSVRFLIKALQQNFLIHLNQVVTITVQKYLWTSCI